MKILEMRVQLEYDDKSMYEEGPEGYKWFLDDVLKINSKEWGLALYSDELADHIGNVKVLSIDESPHLLDFVYRDCVAQVRYGKGEQRHGLGKDFLNQKWFRITDAVGLGFLTGQAMKKTEEAQVIKEVDEWEKEMLGAINYLATAVLYRRIKENRME